MADDDDAAATLAAELELLAAMYSEEEHSVQTSAAETVITIVLRPQAGDANPHQQRFVEVTLELRVHTPGYPASPAGAKLVRARGLVEDEEAELLHEVRQRAEQAAYECEPALFALVDVAVERLTSLNTGGACPICREPLFDSSGDQPAPPCFLTSCYHSFHTPCLGAWWYTCHESGGPAPNAAAAEGASVSRSIAAAATSKAADAKARDLRAKAQRCAETTNALRERAAQLQAIAEEACAKGGLTHGDEAAARKAEEAVTERERELAHAAELASTPVQGARAAAEEASAAEAAERDAASDAPLPCPVAAPRWSWTLREAGVERKPPALE